MELQWVLAPLGPTFSNVFLCYHGKIWLQNCSSKFKPVIYKKQVDDTILIFCSKYNIEKFRNYLNRQHKNFRFRFTSETEHGNSILFLNIIISSNNKKFTTLVYCKPSSSGVFTNFGKFIPKSSNYNLLFTLLHRAFKFCSNFEHLHQEIDKLKTVFRSSKSSVDFIIKRYLDEVFIKKELALKASKKELIYVLCLVQKSHCSRELVQLTLQKVT